MHASRLAPAAMLLALAAAPQADGGSRFTGNVCRLVPASQIVAVIGNSSRCTNSPTARGLGSTIYTGSWAGKTPRAPGLQVTIALYTDPGALQLANRNLKQGLPGKPRRVAGIGGGAYEATGAGSTGIHFGVGKYIAYLSLGRPRAATSLEALAKAVASRL